MVPVPVDDTVKVDDAPVQTEVLAGCTFITGPEPIVAVTAVLGDEHPFNVAST